MGNQVGLLSHLGDGMINETQKHALEKSVRAAKDNVTYLTAEFKQMSEASQRTKAQLDEAKQTLADLSEGMELAEYWK